MKKILLLLLLTSSFLLAQNFSVEREIVSAAKTKNDFTILKYTIKNSQGEITATIIKNISYDLPFPALKVFGDGSSVLISVFDAKLEFYGKKGEFLSETSLAENYEYERSILPALSKNLFACAMCEPKLKNAKIFLFGKNGTKLNEFEAGIKNVTGIEINNEGNLLALSGINQTASGDFPLTEFTTNSGEIIFQIAQRFNSGKFFNESNEFLGWNKRKLFVVSLKDKSVKNEYFSPNGSLIITAFPDNNIWYVTYANAKIVNKHWIYSDLKLNMWSYLTGSNKAVKLKIKSGKDIRIVKKNVLYLKIDDKLFPCSKLLR